MKWSDAKYFIPGVNIIYIIKDRNNFLKKEKQIRQDFANLEKKCAEDTNIVKLYVSQREQAIKDGNPELAKEYDNKIADLAMSYLRL